jgi:hypothetical protein
MKKILRREVFTNFVEMLWVTVYTHIMIFYLKSIMFASWVIPDLSA